MRGDDTTHPTPWQLRHFRPQQTKVGLSQGWCVWSILVPDNEAAARRIPNPNDLPKKAGVGGEGLPVWAGIIDIILFESQTQAAHHMGLGRQSASRYAKVLGGPMEMLIGYREPLPWRDLRQHTEQQAYNVHTTLYTTLYVTYFVGLSADSWASRPTSRLVLAPDDTMRDKHYYYFVGRLDIGAFLMDHGLARDVYTLLDVPYRPPFTTGQHYLGATPERNHTQHNPLAISIKKKCFLGAAPDPRRTPLFTLWLGQLMRSLTRPTGALASQDLRTPLHTTYASMLCPMRTRGPAVLYLDTPAYLITNAMDMQNGAEVMGVEAHGGNESRYHTVTTAPATPLGRQRQDWETRHSRERKTDNARVPCFRSAAPHIMVSVSLLLYPTSDVVCTCFLILFVNPAVNGAGGHCRQTPDPWSVHDVLRQSHPVDWGPLGTQVKRPKDESSPTPRVINEHKVIWTDKGQDRGQERTSPIRDVREEGAQDKRHGMEASRIGKWSTAHLHGVLLPYHRATYILSRTINGDCLTPCPALPCPALPCLSLIILHFTQPLSPVEFQTHLCLSIRPACLISCVHVHTTYIRRNTNNSRMTNGLCNTDLYPQATPVFALRKTHSWRLELLCNVRCIAH
ncbi:hypothetical protein ACRALDRAFT_1093057 [Sodiomyces alcalophilus JCM 7366]|uniref:uncharacterized protein n=1 Tax=Sodiomyces alcalophilus JCM 7366 TaxID=591952 RepID=UPI0039B669BE